MAHSARLIYHPDFLLHDFGPDHLLRPERIVLALDLLQELAIWDSEEETSEAIPAGDELLSLVHDEQYIAAVRTSSEGGDLGAAATRFGLGSGDTPAFRGMHYTSALGAGGAALGVRTLLESKAQHIFHPAGGWHHAQRSRASGFCIYNDPALAAAIARQEYGARVLYLDFDCHHGDGVQWLFYDDPEVFTLSFHESGRFLFPGTGDIEERGEGDGFGYACNMPFMPYTTDAAWQAAIQVLVRKIASRYRPDILITVHGCDTHAWDPLTHLCLTTDSLEAAATLAHEVAHEHCDGRWIAFGSGGYDWRRVVPRSWAILWAEMTNRVLPRDVPNEWRNRWNRIGADPLPPRFSDEPDIIPDVWREETAAHNRQVLDTVLDAIA